MMALMGVRISWLMLAMKLDLAVSAAWASSCAASATVRASTASSRASRSRPSRCSRSAAARSAPVTSVHSATAATMRPAGSRTGAVWSRYTAVDPSSRRSATSSPTTLSPVRRERARGHSSSG